LSNQTAEKFSINQTRGTPMKISTYVISVLLISSASSVHAVGVSTGPVGAVLAGENAVVFFNSGTHQNKPACSTVANDWAINLATPGGKALLATLLTAYSLKKSIYVSGKGVCDAWPDRETVNYLYTME
jgi:hypothetical protein